MKRASERKWRSTKSSVDKECYLRNKSTVTNLVKQEKEKILKEKVELAGRDQKFLFNVVGDLVTVPKPPAFPDRVKFPNRSDDFANFFISKVSEIRDHTRAVLSRDALCISSSSNANDTDDDVFNNFKLISEDEVIETIKNAPTKSCDLDPLPACLMKKFIHVLSPHVTKVINRSLSESVFPSCFKKAIIKPLLKKSSLDTNVLKNYRPVSNLPFLSKVAERLVLTQINAHKATTDKTEFAQSAYKKGHSTETALMLIQNDILKALDSNRCVLMVLLDLSAAFDCLDHNILLSRLQSEFSVTGAALKWFSSYLSNRIMTVDIEGEKSSPRDLLFGVPQGSVLGPTLFTDYIYPLGNIARSHEVTPHFYADDTQLYISFNPENQGEFHAKLKSCISDIRTWMLTNSLKLNDDKSEFIIFGNKKQLEKCDIPHTYVGSNQIKLSHNVRNIGVQLDNGMTMKPQITSVSRSCWFYISQLWHIRKYLTTEQTKILVHAFIISRLDGFNSLLFGLPASYVKPLQRVQNAAAKLVFKARKYDSVTPLLHSLHWLPVSHRIKFKILLVTFKCLRTDTPQYLAELLSVYNPTRTLRSKADGILLSVPKSRLKSLGDRSFAYSAPTLWNSLPSEIRSANSVANFKKSLKTFLFTDYFSD